MNTTELFRHVTIPDTEHTMHNVSLKGKCSNTYKQCGQVVNTPLYSRG